MVTQTTRSPRAPVDGARHASPHLWLGSERTLVGQLVGVALIVRMLAVLGGLLLMLARDEEPLTPLGTLLVWLLAASSFAGLTRRRAFRAVLERPLLAAVDVVLLLGVIVVLGIGSPLVLAALSTALLVGLLQPREIAIPLCALLTGGHVLSATEVAPDGAAGAVLLTALPTAYICLTAVGLTVRRIAIEQSVAQERLAEVLEATATASERARLAREMHDSLAKTVQGVALAASSLPAWVDKDPVRACAQARVVAEGASRAVAEARELLAHMRRDAPQQPLAVVVQSVVARWAEQRDVVVGTDLDDVRGLSAAVRYELLACLSEALENVSRHSRASAVEVVLRGEAEQVLLAVRDDGTGFDRAVAARREAEGHYGLRGMEERMAGVGGSARITTRAGAGTSVDLRAPVTVAEEEWR